MATFSIRKGKDIRLAGAAKKEIVSLALPGRVGVQPIDFRGIKPRLVVKEGDAVKVGSPIFTDKTEESVRVVSPVSGRIATIVRGEKRALLSIIIESDNKQDKEVFDIVSSSNISNLSKDDIVKNLLNGGLWPVIRQRPFSKVANPKHSPKSIFVRGMSTDPLAPDVDFLLDGKKSEFQAGLDILSKLTKGGLHLCLHEKSKAPALVDAKNVTIHRFNGSHPTGNVGTHIHYIDPIKKGDIVWYVEAVDVARIGELFLKGTYPAERIIAITGEGAKNKIYVKTIEGAPVSLISQGSTLAGMRCISGSILSGKNVGAEGFVGFYDRQITILPEGGKREFLGWMDPGFKKYTFSHTFMSSFFPQKEASLTTDENGSHRAIVLNHVYDSLNTLDVLTYFLLKAILIGDIEEAEKLGILECDAEDFALCTFACPSKVDVAAIIKEGLDVVEQEG